jgi:hypothetical protein
MTRRLRAALVAGCAGLSMSCAPALMKLPTAGGTLISARDADEALGQAVAACSGVRSMTAEISVSGSVAGRRLRVRIIAGVVPPRQARLEALAPFGAPLFIFASTDDVATLLLPRDGRVLERASSMAVLETIAGAPLATADLDSLMTGCAPREVKNGARRVGDTWQVMRVGSDEIYLHREAGSAPWVLAARVRRTADLRREWREEFRDHRDGLPRAIRLSSVDLTGQVGGEFDLQLALTQVEVNVPLPGEAFTVDVPRGAVSITLDELRRSGPFAQP